MNKIYECIKCGQTAQGFECACSLQPPPGHPGDHEWIEVTEEPGYFCAYCGQVWYGEDHACEQYLVHLEKQR